MQSSESNKNKELVGAKIVLSALVLTPLFFAAVFCSVGVSGAAWSFMLTNLGIK